MSDASQGHTIGFDYSHAGRWIDRPSCARRRTQTRCIEGHLRDTSHLLILPGDPLPFPIHQRALSNFRSDILHYLTYSALPSTDAFGWLIRRLGLPRPHRWRLLLGLGNNPRVLVVSGYDSVIVVTRPHRDQVPNPGSYCDRHRDQGSEGHEGSSRLLRRLSDSIGSVIGDRWMLGRREMGR
jgi:hypothetical protein